jgi:hypothetical protein
MIISDSSESNRSLIVTPKFSIFLKPKEKVDTARKDEVNDRGLFLPLERYQWEISHGVGKFRGLIIRRW